MRGSFLLNRDTLINAKLSNNMPAHHPDAFSFQNLIIKMIIILPVDSMMLQQSFQTISYGLVKAASIANCQIAF